MKYAPPKQQPFLVEVDADGTKASERIVFDRIAEIRVKIHEASGNTGHGAGTPLSETTSQQVDRLAFMFNSLGMQYKTVP